MSEPDGKMPKAYQQLVAFCKTEVIKPKISKKIKLCFDICNFACYDEGNAEFVLEKGDYFVRVGNSSRNTHIVAQRSAVNVMNVALKTAYFRKSK